MFKMFLGFAVLGLLCNVSLTVSIVLCDCYASIQLKVVSLKFFCCISLKSSGIYSCMLGSQCVAVVNSMLCTVYCCLGCKLPCN